MQNLMLISLKYIEKLKKVKKGIIKKVKEKGNF